MGTITKIAVRSSYLQLAVFLFAVAFTGTAVCNSFYWLRMTHEDASFFFLSSLLFDHEELIDRAMAAFQPPVVPGDDHQILDHQYKSSQFRDFLMFSAMVRLTSALLGWHDISADHQALALTIGSLITFALVAGVSIWLVLNRAVWGMFPFTLTIILMACIEGTAAWKIHWRLSLQSQLGEYATNSLLFFINPDVPFSLFGYTPRNFFVLFAMALFAIRWGNRLSVYYCWMLLSVPLHRPYSLLFFAVSISIDLIYRRDELRDRYTVLAIGGFVLCHAILIAKFIPPYVVLIVLIVIASGLIYRAARSELQDVVRMRILYDFTILTGVLIAISMASWIGTQISPVRLQRLYFWSELSGRPIALFRGVLLLGATAIGFTFIKEHMTERSFHIASRALCVLLIGVTVGGSMVLLTKFAMRGYQTAPIEADRRLEETRAQNKPLEHRTFYLALSKALMAGDDHLSPDGK